MRKGRWLWVAGILIVSAEVVLEVIGRGAGACIAREAVQVFVRQHEPISLNVVDQNLDSVYYFFDPSLRPYLRQIPIITSDSAQTAYTFYARDDAAFVALSPDFFKTAQQSEFWPEYYSQPTYNLKPDQPVFPEEFRMELLIHEFMHVTQEYLAIDPRLFFRQVEKWYLDESYGRPTQPKSDLDDRIKPNRTKYLLWWNLYSQPGAPDNESETAWKAMKYCNRYKNITPGIEELAYVGAAILWPTETEARMARFSELSESLFNSYRGIINPAILTLGNRERPRQK